MALVNLTNIVVLDNPTSFTNPFTFEVTFECVQELEDGMWLGGVCVAEERWGVIMCLVETWGRKGFLQGRTFSWLPYRLRMRNPLSLSSCTCVGKH